MDEGNKSGGLLTNNLKRVYSPAVYVLHSFYGEITLWKTYPQNVDKHVGEGKRVVLAIDRNGCQDKKQGYDSMVFGRIIYHKGACFLIRSI